MGTVDEILQEQTGTESADTVQIAVTVVSDSKTAIDWLTARDDVEVQEAIQESVGGKLIKITYWSQPEKQADLLAAMIDAGIRIAGFTSKQKSLEDVFLSVTRGHVQ